MISNIEDYYWDIFQDQRKLSKYTVGSDGRFPCQRCGKTSYKQKTHLIRHLHFECGMEPRFVCSCGKKFKQRSNFNTHLKITGHIY
ncbi:unnamed protein product [Phaedon cochleariae]|uniref:C2H2-type domain-containing protein n=1 Tax=Phaedon cochleariae TaxID=80249 RepID=A0A9P0DHJ0_PHACE|nr:unnamed protein product [Phaedon cochleariae]